MVVIWLVLAAVPLALSTWALLDAARRPAWAWSLAERSQLAWLTAIGFGVFLSLAGMGIAGWYLLRVRPQVAAVERGDLDRLSRGVDPPHQGGSHH